MAWTYVRLELIDPDTQDYPPMYEAMEKAGFVRTLDVKTPDGRVKTKRLPSGMYRIENVAASSARDLALVAVQHSGAKKAAILAIETSVTVAVANLRADSDEDLLEAMFLGED
jgi:hypothetical protein